MLSRSGFCFLSFLNICHTDDEEKYLVKDTAAERKFSFSLKDSLQRARQGGVLNGRKIYVTPSVLPPPVECAQIIQAAGGILVSSQPDELDDTLIISCKEDAAEYKHLASMGFSIYQAEVLLIAALCQRLDLSRRNSKLL